MKDGSSLVVIPSSIPSSATHRPNTDLSSDEGPEEVLEDFKDELTMKKTLIPTRRIVVSTRPRP